MPQTLRDWLEIIGKEELPEATVDEHGRVGCMTKDERLCRLIWQRSLGYTETIAMPNGQESHTVHPPEAKAQAFIFERREGRQPLAPTDANHRPDTLERMRKTSQTGTNDLAQQSLDDDDNDQQIDPPDSVSD